MKVLLINPPAYKIIEVYYDTPPYPRTGIACLAGYLREKGIDVHVLDCKYDQLSLKQGVEAINQIKPDIIGFGAFTNEIMQAAEMARAVKDENPAAITLIGGVHVTAIPEETMREFPQFDYGIVGEGEETLYELIQNIADRDALSKTPGVCFVDQKSNYIFGGERKKIIDQNTLPFPAWDLFRPAEEYILHTARGCPFACNFCMNPNGRMVRSRSPQNVINEIEWLTTFSEPKRILFGDEIFTIDQERAADIFRGLINRGFNKKFSWWCQTHVKTINKELVVLMKKSNCDLVGLGIESGDEERLKSMGKGTTVADIWKAVKIMKDIGVPFMAFFILGQPNETYKTALHTINFAVKLNPTLPIFGIMVPYPGTKIAEMARKGEGDYVLLSTDWNEYNKQFGNALAFNNLSRKQLEKLQIIGYLKVFILNFRIIDLVKFILKYKREGFAVIKKNLRSIFKPS